MAAPHLALQTPDPNTLCAIWFEKPDLSATSELGELPGSGTGSGLRTTAQETKDYSEGLQCSPYCRWPGMVKQGHGKSRNHGLCQGEGLLRETGQELACWAH